MVAYFAPLSPDTLGGTLNYVLQILGCVAICLFVLWRGQRDQRIVAGLFLSMCLLGVFLLDRLNFEDPQGRFLWIDGFEFVVIGWLAVRNGALWLILMGALQLLCLTTGITHRYAHDIIGLTAYVWLYTIWNWEMLFVLTVATLMVMRQGKADPAAQVAGGDHNREAPGW